MSGPCQPSDPIRFLGCFPPRRPAGCVSFGSDAYGANRQFGSCEPQFKSVLATNTSTYLETISFSCEGPPPAPIPVGDDPVGCSEDSYITNFSGTGSISNGLIYEMTITCDSGDSTTEPADGRRRLAQALDTYELDSTAGWETVIVDYQNASTQSIVARLELCR